MNEIWTKPGDRGLWTDPGTGKQHWLYPIDRLMDLDGTMFIVRVVDPSLISIFGEPVKCVWVSVVADGGPFQHIATISAGDGIYTRVELEVRCWLRDSCCCGRHIADRVYTG